MNLHTNARWFYKYGYCGFILRVKNKFALPNFCRSTELYMLFVFFLKCIGCFFFILKIKKNMLNGAPPSTATCRSMHRTRWTEPPYDVNEPSHSNKHSNIRASTLSTTFHTLGRTLHYIQMCSYKLRIFNSGCQHLHDLAFCLQNYFSAISIKKADPMILPLLVVVVLMFVVVGFCCLCFALLFLFSRM